MTIPRALGLATAVGTIAFVQATPAAARIQQFNIPPGNLKPALDAFAGQSGVQLLYRPDDVRRARTDGLRGSFGPVDGLSVLLRGSGFTVRRDASGALAIVRRSQAEAAPKYPVTNSTSGLEPADLPAIIVTGSRIPQANLDSPSPVTSVSTREIEMSGASRTEDVLNALPQIFANQGANISNGASGTAVANLRGLGPSRTLVLVNGRRLQAGDMLSPYPDTNFVPLALVERIEVLTGGASSVYGADAVAGVVNFILDTRQTGLRIEGQTAVFAHDNRSGSGIAEANSAVGFHPPTGWSVNGGTTDLSGIFGAEFDDGRGRVTAFAAYRKQDPVLQATRDYSFCSLVALPEQLAAELGRRFTCSGPMVSANGTFVQLDPVSLRTIGVSQVSGTSFVPGFTPFNTGPYNYFQRPDERYNFGAFAEYELARGAVPYAELMVMDDQSRSQIAPSGSFGDVSSIACDNALLSAQQRGVICAPGRTFFGPLNGQANVEQAVVYTLRRNVEGGGREDDIGHRAFRLTAGVRGEISPGVEYDGYYLTGRTERESTYLHDFSIVRLGRALDAVVDPGSGQILCRAALTGIDPNCVPYDVFSQGGVTPQALQYLEAVGHQRGAIQETIAHFDVTISGEPLGWRSPWAERGVGLNVGAEYRKESLDFKVSDEFRTGDLAGQGGPTPPVAGNFDVRELFGEAEFPIVEHNLIDELTLSGGYRYSSYHVAGHAFSTGTYKLAAELAPVPDLRFRASYNRAVRAPNIVELFLPQSLGVSSGIDPCANSPGGTPRWTLEQCKRTGVTEALYGFIIPSASGQYNVLFGGNSDLRPEKADTLTAGVVVQPRFVPGLAVTADYFDIRVRNVISAANFRATLEACGAASGPSGDAACAQVHRSPSGSLWLGSSGFVDLRNRNFDGVGIRSAGVDLNAAYSRTFAGFGSLSVAFLGTYLFKLRVPGVPGDCAGRFAGTCGTPSPKWRHKLRVDFSMPAGFGVSAGWRHFSGVEAQPADPYPGERRLNAVDYFDLGVRARLTDALTLRAGATNILDRDPPVAGALVGVGFGNGNTYPQVYDALGRYLFAGFTVNF